MKLPKLKDWKDLAALLRSLPDELDASAEMGFDMRESLFSREQTSHPCGSACSIGGWAQACGICPEGQGTEAVAALFSGVDISEICFLTHPREHLGVEWGRAWYATPQQAARAVEILGETGKCDWPRAMREGAA